MSSVHDSYLYWYQASLRATKRDPTGVVDGDTMNITMDWGGHLYQQRALRVDGVNAPEMSTLAGKTAKQWAIDWFATNVGPVGTPFIVHTFLDPEDKYGRLLAVIYAPNDRCFNDDIIAASQAVAYNP